MNSHFQHHKPVMHPVDDMDFPRNPSMLPKIYRLTSIRNDQDERLTLCTATLYHERAKMKVSWTTSKPDLRLKVGDLVAPRWLFTASCENGTIRIARLVRMERPEPWENLFHTVPCDWVDDRQLIAQAADLIEALPRPCRYLFNAIFWDGQRFRRYCTAPSTLSGPHSDECGTLYRAVDVAFLLEQMAKDHVIADAGLGILAGLLHDAGKADEFRQVASGEWKQSDRGRLLGHKITLIEWIAEARAMWNVLMTEENYLSLLHSLSCSASAPDWLGSRKSTVLEAALLANMGSSIATQEM